MFERDENKSSDTRLAWIEPKIEELHVNETAAASGGGADGGTSVNSQRS
ncbi:hypothetical protein FHS83_002286 [Rhizomicrobium palustre]|uniref:Uncharacterized protein n=1 Tax=Rhizomicrobium palustre TaxID=189966 RepID=A0A846MZB9_9PROT|nr:hypothetical protein [Rhizomicrobium palustre]NIK88968.1 hypothetical protein [Rhizomicrobium palustre]